MKKELIDFLVNHLRIKEEEASCVHTRLEEDLYIYGEDAEWLLIEYSDLFKVDITHFDLSKYFTGELWFSYTLYRRFSKRYLQKKSLTIGDLERGIEYGRLDDDIVSMRSDPTL